MAQIIADPDGAAMRDARDAALRGDAEAVEAWLTTPLSQSEFNRQWILKHVCFGTGGPGSPACVGAVPLSRAPLWLAIEPA